MKTKRLKTDPAKLKNKRSKMQITNKVMEIVEQKEEAKINLRRCLDTLTCPECGETLTRQELKQVECFIPIKYTCNICPFTYTT